MNDKPWTKRELTISQNPVLDLIEAVLYQWQLDGCPKSDAEAIEWWKQLKESLIYEN